MPEMRGRRVHLALIVVTALVMGLTLTTRGTAQAHGVYGPGSTSGCPYAYEHDYSTWSLHWTQLHPNGSTNYIWWSWMDNRVQNEFKPLVINKVSYHASEGSKTDVIVHAGDYENMTNPPCPGFNWNVKAGAADCVSNWPSNRCNKHRTYFDHSDLFSLGEAGVKSLACHEFGHALRLPHYGSPSCMNDPLDGMNDPLDGFGWFPQGLDQHERDHVYLDHL